jgi:hypothetical protein
VSARRGWSAGLAGLALTLATAPPASASLSTPVDLGAGDSPAVVVDPAGTAHIVFNSAGGETYCRLPRGAKACAALTALPLPGRAGGPLIVRRPSDGLLAVVQAAGGDQSGLGTTWIRYSADGGATWQGPFAAGTLGLVSSAVAAQDGSGLLTLDPAARAGLTFQWAPFSGSDGRSVVIDAPAPGVSFGASSDARVAALAGGQVLAAEQTSRGVNWSFFAGGDVLSPAAWKHGTLRGAARPELVTGSRGTYLLTQRGPLHQNGGAFALRSFDARRGHFRASRNAVADTTIYGTSSLFEDAGGRLHVVADTAVTARVGCVVYARTTNKRSSWFGRSTTIYRTHRSARFPEDSVVAANGKGRGVAVWQDHDAARSGGHVRAVALHQRGGRYHRIGSELSRPSCPPS